MRVQFRPLPGRRSHERNDVRHKIMPSEAGPRAGGQFGWASPGEMGLVESGRSLGLGETHCFDPHPRGTIWAIGRRPIPALLSHPRPGDDPITPEGKIRGLRRGAILARMPVFQDADPIAELPRRQVWLHPLHIPARGPFAPCFGASPCGHDKTRHFCQMYTVWLRKRDPCPVNPSGKDRPGTGGKAADGQRAARA
jgi:hypothetical protein